MQNSNNQLNQAGNGFASALLAGNTSMSKPLYRVTYGKTERLLCRPCADTTAYMVRQSAFRIPLGISEHSITVGECPDCPARKASEKLFDPER
jgi:hypothetical protein